jgi:hypothetical protein
MSIFHIINFKKKIMDTEVLDFFNEKLILDYYFCLKSGPVFLIQIFMIASLPLPRDIQLYMDFPHCSDCLQLENIALGHLTTIYSSLNGVNNCCEMPQSIIT